ncbi:glycine--tRNA ligase subunit alpha [Candidatus Purcelliella pentastirinorum]|uniref:Glycine--tRNA ligase alpha subunit n=1 Tax=Candidatus Purcelliella pentastirinorum TaxID=472834 RepID=A0AAX3NB55_9ENTR|nr:glycine--tRNA ligase subunit alpha [Candidatus Purcelliella pentastirinorum]WDI78711.1 glycine--tRNA ligase subunit alpha [Candidatus Purcelliella pentastirinorum]WDR80678.1 glycine--tRNA ligase subunit alpha [Candidatus Purcelliella pentastirinorum]
MNKNLKKTNFTFQKIIRLLQKYWSGYGCHIYQAIDIEVGAGTSHPLTCLKALGSDPFSAIYVQPSRRPNDGRYGMKNNRLQHYYQLQVIIKPSPKNFQDLYINSLKFLKIDLNKNDLRFIEDNWENPTLGACGVGWEVWLNGMEISQFTYFQQVGCINCKPITGEITYGLERIAMHIQKIENIYNIIWDSNKFNKMTYGEIFKRNEFEHSIYNFEYSNINFLINIFNQYKKEIDRLLKKKQLLIHPIYENILKIIHIFNLLDARNVISVIERQNHILCIRNLMKILTNRFYLEINK